MSKESTGVLPKATSSPNRGSAEIFVLIRVEKCSRFELVQLEILI